jgi:uncharacterized protein YecE (DUF72 family)
MMRFIVGTSGYDYPKWKGSFYPDKLPRKEMLSYYAQQFSAVEINGSFYRMPTMDVVESWAREVPDSFQFVLKAPQTITHRKRLKNSQDELDVLIKTSSVLKQRLGPLLFQLPPNFKKDLPKLESFLGLIDGGVRAAFEFRHQSWFDDEVFACLRANSCALCIADADDLPVTDVVGTTGWGYVRLRREEYTDECLGEWVEKLRSQAWDEAYVFFKHEDTGTGPKLASRFNKLVETKRMPRID